MVICGRNLALRTIRPAGGALGGSFVDGHGAFSTGRIPPGNSVVVLGSFAGVTVSDTVADDHTVDVELTVSAPGRVSGPGSAALDDYEVTTRPPVAADDTASTTEAASVVVSVLANDTDPDPGDTLVVSATGGSPIGDVSITGGGTTITYDPDGQFEPLDVGESFVDQFTYTAEDTSGATDTANVSVTVNGLDDDPVAVNDAVTTPEDTNLVRSASSTSSSSFAANDTDVDIETLTITAVTGAANGTVTLASGQVTFDPDQDFCGSAGFDYTVSDGDGATDDGFVAITVTGVNDAPVVDPDTFSLAENSANGTAVGTVTFTDVDTRPPEPHASPSPAATPAAPSPSTRPPVRSPWPNNAALDFETTPELRLTVRGDRRRHPGAVRRRRRSPSTSPTSTRRRSSTPPRSRVAENAANGTAVGTVDVRRSGRRPDPHLRHHRRQHRRRLRHRLVDRCDHRRRHALDFETLASLQPDRRGHRQRHAGRCRTRPRSP